MGGYRYEGEPGSSPESLEYPTSLERLTSCCRARVEPRVQDHQQIARNQNLEVGEEHPWSDPDRAERVLVSVLQIFEYRDSQEGILQPFLFRRRGQRSC